jgi:hypothetical protein
MKRVAKIASGLGCLTSIVAPLLGVLLYPKANWLFALVLIGVAIIVLQVRFAKDPTPEAFADEIQRLLTGNYGGWDVDNFEHRGIRDPQLKDFWHRAMRIGSLPEDWMRLDEKQKDQLRGVIRELRELGEAQRSSSGQPGASAPTRS